MPFIARFKNTKFATLGGPPVNFGQSSCPCAYQRIKGGEAINIFFKELIAAPNLASFSPTKTGELTIAPFLKGKLNPAAAARRAYVHPKCSGSAGEL
jgi:hypothetical protein